MLLAPIPNLLITPAHSAPIRQSKALSLTRAILMLLLITIGIDVAVKVAHGGFAHSGLIWTECELSQHFREVC